MVAAAKLRKAQDKMTSTRPYANKIEEVVGRLANNNDASNPVMRMPEEFNNILFIVIGSDRGLCGGFNNNLFKDVESKIHSNFATHEKNGTLSMITIGKKATAYFKKRKYNVVEQFPGFFDDIEYHKTSEIMETAIEQFVNGDYDEVYISYNEFKSVIAQNRKTQKVLPIDPETIGKLNPIMHLNLRLITFTSQIHRRS